MPTSAPGKAGAASSSNTISIDVTKDLDSASDLAKCFVGQGPAIFSIGVEVAKYAGQEVQKAVGAKPATIKLSGDPKWKLPSKIAFSLTLDASCTIGISRTSTKFSVKKNIDSDDKMDICAGPTGGTVYVNIDLDFDIKGTLSGSGSLGAGVGISGKASGSKSATLSYCHPADETMETEAAVRAAFAALFFPFQPDCTLHMPTGSIGKVNFDGSFNVELDVTYGLGNHKFSATDLISVKGSVDAANGRLNPPSLDIDTGAKGSVVYQHSDNFCAIVEKVDAKAARLFLTRSASDETTESVGITVGISLKSPATATVDPAKLTHAIAAVTKGGPPNLGTAVASYAPEIESSLVAKTNAWLSKNDVGLTASLSQSKDRTMLFAFNVDLSSPGSDLLATQSWTYFVNGDLQKALQLKGFTLLPGSGVAEHLKRASTIQLHFFNFQLAKTTDFFKNSGTSLGPEGSIRFFADIGEESQFSTQSNSTNASVHFTTTATEDPATGDYQSTEVDLCIELSESKNPEEANRIASCIGALVASPDINEAEHKMQTFVAANPSKTLCLVTVFKPSAYGKLTCSPFTVGDDNKPHPPALPQEQDRDNWNAFHNMVMSLMPDMAFVVSDLRYVTWMSWNVQANDQIGSQPDANHVPDRMSLGNTDASAIHIFGQNNNWRMPNNYLIASTGFMNLCDHLHTLASTLAEVNTATQWKQLIETIITWVKAGEANPDWSKPALAALLYLCSTVSYKASTDFLQPADNSKLTCTLTLS